MYNQLEKTIHLIFSQSAKGSLQMALREDQLLHKESILAVYDLFSVGPVWQLHQWAGVENRYEWLMNHITIADELRLNYEKNYEEIIDVLAEIPEHHELFIWVGENAEDQTALRWALYMLKEKTNKVTLINAYELAQQKIDFTPRHLGELSAEQLQQIYADKEQLAPLTEQQRHHFEEQWLTLSSDQKTLRIWQEHELQAIEENYFDSFIIDTIKRLHTEYSGQEFIKAVRVIGDAIAHLERHVDDEFLEFRLQRLIEKGILAIEGTIERGVLHYSVKINK